MRRLLLTLALILTATWPARAENLRTAILGGGCFWCVEADFDKVDGVVETVSGYTEGTIVAAAVDPTPRPGNKRIEAVRVTYDADIVDYETLVTLFLRSIDPLDDGGQFCDRGDLYRTAIFVTAPQDRAVATAALEAARDALGAPVVTTVRQLDAFYPAQEGHQNYAYKNPLRYGVYRKGCGRDRRVRELWGAAASFAGTS